MTGPVPLDGSHDLSAFDCGEPSLNAWLKDRAPRNQGTGATRTFVLVRDGKVIAYHALAAGSVHRATATARARRNMPEPVPALVLGRLAVDLGWQNKGLGGELLRDAVLRAVQAADMVGIRGMLVHALSEEAKAFYLRRGFRPSPIDPMTVMITLAEARNALAGNPG